MYLYQDDPKVGIRRLINTRGGKNWLDTTYEKYKHEPYYVNRGQRSPDLHLDFLYEYATAACSAYSKCRLNSLAIDNTAWDWTTYKSRIINYLKWSYSPDPVIPLSELPKYTGV